MINHIENVFCRIDVIEIFFHNGKYKINYLKNCVHERPFKKIYFDEKEFEDYEQ